MAGLHIESGDFSSWLAKKSDDDDDDDDGGGGGDIIIRYLFANVRNRITHDLEIGILPALQEAEAEDAMGIRPDEEARKDLAELTSCIEFQIVFDSSWYFFLNMHYV